MRIPKKISPDPIIEAVVEIRFDSAVPPDTILGMVFPHVKDLFSNFKKLPAAQFPDDLRNSNPQLRYMPYYESVSGPYQLNIGPNVLSLVNAHKYVGWDDNFFPFLEDICSRIEKSGVVKKYLRIGLRYIDFFEKDIFDDITLSILHNGEPIKARQTTVSTISEEDSILTRVLIQNNTTVSVDNRQAKGSIIDTDTCWQPVDGIASEQVLAVISNIHKRSLATFFDLLKDDFISTLKPEYSE